MAGVGVDVVRFAAASVAAWTLGYTFGCMGELVLDGGFGGFWLMNWCVLVVTGAGAAGTGVRVPLAREYAIAKPGLGVSPALALDLSSDSAGEWACETVTAGVGGFEGDAGPVTGAVVVVVVVVAEVLVMAAASRLAASMVESAACSEPESRFSRCRLIASNIL